MAEYIEREALLQRINDAQESLYSNDDKKWRMNKPYFKGLAWANRIIIEFPAADVAEVKHGEWIEWHGDKMVAEDVYRHYHYNTCSVCYKGNAVKSNFCPNCGAKMKG